MGKTLREMMAELPEDEREEIEAEAVRLIAEEYTLREFRKQIGITQTSLAEAMGIGQDEVSRIERRSDMMLSTVRRYVEAAGGHLSLLARLPDGTNVEITGIGDIVRTDG